ncbi:Os05g0169701, partial [Oryza sativa Japonica Group]
MSLVGEMGCLGSARFLVSASVPTPLPAFLASTPSSCRMPRSNAATSFMVGRSSGRGLAHSNAMPRACSISWTWVSGRPCNLTSMISAGSRFRQRWSRTHCTTLCPSPNAGSSGRRPVIISSSTTPKLYTSLLVVILVMHPYSA